MVVLLYIQFLFHIFVVGLEFEKKISNIIYRPSEESSTRLDVSICNKIKSVTKKPRRNNKNAILSRQKRNSKNKLCFCIPLCGRAGHYRRSQHDARSIAGSSTNNLILPGLIGCRSSVTVRLDHVLKTIRTTMAALSGGETCIKHLMFAFNLIFWVSLP